MAERSKKGGSKMTEKEKNMEIFKIIKETRDFEIDMFWRRTNYFLLLNSAVGGGLFLILANLENFEGLDINHINFLFSVIGIFVCLAWINIGLGNKFWQSHWEQVLVDWQKKIDLKGYYGDIFSTKHNEERVKDNLYKDDDDDSDDYYDSNAFEKFSKRGLIHRIICFFPYVLIFTIKGDHKDHKFRVLKKPSVSRWMHRTACFFFIVWFCAFLFSIHNMVCDDFLCSLPQHIMYCNS